MLTSKSQFSGKPLRIIHRASSWQHTRQIIGIAFSREPLRTSRGTHLVLKQRTFGFYCCCYERSPQWENPGFYCCYHEMSPWTADLWVWVLLSRHKSSNWRKLLGLSVVVITKGLEPETCGLHCNCYCWPPPDRKYTAAQCQSTVRSALKYLWWYWSVGVIENCYHWPPFDHHLTDYSPRHDAKAPTDCSEVFVIVIVIMDHHLTEYRPRHDACIETLTHACTHTLRLRLPVFCSVLKTLKQKPHTHVFPSHMVVIVYDAKACYRLLWSICGGLGWTHLVPGLDPCCYYDYYDYCYY